MNKGFLFSTDALLALGIVVLGIGLWNAQLQAQNTVSDSFFTREAIDHARLHSYRAEPPSNDEKTNCNELLSICVCQSYSYRINTQFFVNQVCVGK